ncbi:hypothetical protein [Paenibacillus crassostreae]|uniref:Uncharacterized protein n=1 Tax=Paenibacillus crassostreae TaxID=1763538 RepID=A0A167AUE3_9BACL|nr:hypothetical protein [Paenibacillus crassostreae]AOZ93612.1 hypothetical protein LPB68_16385 [Paenibacillus crassostreae]OAB71439.1 hypothetical protein PNBC_19255 [Paenibacillus crassostreae]
MTEEILMVKIQNTLAEGKDLYNATRGNWVIDKRRFKNIRYVVGIQNGEVVSVYEPKEWSIIESGEDGGRKFFDGIELQDSALFNKFQKAAPKMLEKFGNGQAIGYISLPEI